MTAESASSLFSTVSVTARWQALRGRPSDLLQVGLSALLLLILLTLLTIIFLQIDRPQPQLLAVQRAQPAVVQNWNWFRGTRDAQVAVQAAPELADIKINSDLLGILITAKVSTATLKHAGKPEAVYLLGDEVSAGITLVEIESQRIVVEQSGVRKQLLLKRPDSVIETQSSASARDRDSAPTQQAGFRLANMFGAVPVSLGGAVGSYASGFKLNGLSPEMRSLADVEDGDVVVEVSGSSVEELMKNPATWMSYSGQSNLPVTVIRGGREIVIYVNAASLSAKMLPLMGQN